jgi:hypothetical protein
MLKSAIGFTWTLAVAVLVTVAIIHMLRPQVQEAQGALQYISDNWPK